MGEERHQQNEWPIQIFMKFSCRSLPLMETVVATQVLNSRRLYVRKSSHSSVYSHFLSFSFSVLFCFFLICRLFFLSIFFFLFLFSTSCFLFLYLVWAFQLFFLLRLVCPIYRSSACARAHTRVWTHGRRNETGAHVNGMEWFHGQKKDAGFYGEVSRVWTRSSPPTRREREREREEEREIG